MTHKATARLAAQPLAAPEDIQIADHLIGGAIATAEAAGVPVEHVVAATLRAFIHLATNTRATAVAADALHTLADAMASGAEVSDGN